MSSAAYAPNPPAPRQPQQPRGTHARPSTTIEVRVIPGGLLTQEERLRHAKIRVHGTLQGTPYHLSSRERAIATASGIAFTLISLAALLV